MTAARAAGASDEGRRPAAATSDARRGDPRSGGAGARLLLGPVVRHVTSTSLTVWVETDAPCAVEVSVTGGPVATDRTVAVAGHHYALVVLRGLTPGSGVRYAVRLGERPVWPEAGVPAGAVRLPAAVPERVTIAFGSCRWASPPAVEGHTAARGIGPDALDALAVRVAAAPDRAPDLLLLLGDQVYADEVTPAVRRRIARRRGTLVPPRGQVADFEEYTWLYAESWSDPVVRGLLAQVPTAMVFDDHDVHDDWNTSGAWRRDMAATGWWPERIVAALETAWIYQHLGNLSPDELDADPTWARLRALPPGEDGEPVLRELALAADRETEGPQGPVKGYRWSFARDLGRTRLVVVDSRCGRILDGSRRAMLSDADEAWLRERTAGDYDHLVLATSLPWLLAPALHDVEAWSERLAASRRPRVAAFGEALRRAVDLEHWAAFGESFDRLSGLLRDLAQGRGGRPAPASVSVVSGDVHHSYVARVDWAGGARRGVSGTGALPPAGDAAPVHQLTCSPLHQTVSRVMRTGFAASWGRPAEAVATALRRCGGRRRPGFSWHRVGGGPWLGNAIATLETSGRRAGVTFETSEPPASPEPLRRIVSLVLAGGSR